MLLGERLSPPRCLQRVCEVSATLHAPGYVSLFDSQRLPAFRKDSRSDGLTVMMTRTRRATPVNQGVLQCPNGEAQQITQSLERSSLCDLQLSNDCSQQEGRLEIH